MAKINNVSIEVMKTKTRIYVNYNNGKTEVYNDIVPMKIVRFMNEEDTIKATDNELFKNKTIIFYEKEEKI